VVIANVRDGSTCIFDLINPEDRQSLAGLIRAELVTGLSLHFGGTVASLPAPRRFKQPQFGFELAAGGRAERVFCQAEGVRIALTLPGRGRADCADTHIDLETCTLRLGQNWRHEI
jgi:hypothetical protein